MGKIVISVPFAVAVSLILIGLGAVLSSGGTWFGKAALAVTFFLGVLYTGTAIRKRQQPH